MAAAPCKRFAAPRLPLIHSQPGGWPTCYLIDRQGVLRMAGLFDGDREAAIQALLAETP